MSVDDECGTKNLASLNRLSRTPLTRDFWIAACSIAWLRRAVNDRFRQLARDRGDDKNLLNDVQGVVGELASIAKAQSADDVSEVVHDLVSLEGPVDDVDLKAKTSGGELRLESKCLIWQPRKKLFVINDIAHKRSHRRGATGYLPVLTSEGSSIAIVGPVFPLDELNNWYRYPFQYGDPALGLPLVEFCDRYLATPWRVIREQLESSERAVPDIATLAALVAPAADRIEDVVRKGLLGDGTGSARDIVKLLASTVGPDRDD